MSSAVGIEGSKSSRAEALLVEHSRLLEMVASSAPLEDVLTSLICLIEAQAEGLLGSLLLADEHGQLRHAAAPHLPETYTKAMDDLPIGPREMSRSTAAYRRRPVVVADILEDPLWDEHRSLATQNGLRAFWSVPFFSRQNQLLGTFAMYYQTPRIPSSAELELVDAATRIASIAVERSQSDLKLRAAAEDLRALVEDDLNDIVFSLDVEGNVSYISPRSEGLWGYFVREIVAEPLAQFVHAEDRATLQQSFRDALAGNLKSCEFRVLDRAGNAYWCRASMRPQLPRDQIVGVTGVIVDITKQKEAQNALRRAEERYRTFFEEAIVGIFQTDPSGHYVVANPALAHMLGYDSPEDFRASITDISRQLYVDPQRREEFMRLMAQDGIVRGFEAEVYRKNGSRMWLSANARAVYEDGRIVSYEGTNEEITDRKLLEQQLLQAQKMEAIGQLAGGIAHDFNNLLGVILGHGELLAQRIPSTDPARRRIDQICLAGSRAVSLTGQLLAFSRQQILHPVVLDLNVVVKNLDDMIGRLIGEHIHVLTRLDRALGRTKADPGQLEQVLLNLALNARDAMPLGGTLTIETSNADVDSIARRHTGAKEGRYVVLVVSDTGVGMDQATMSRIFEPFFTTKEAGKGTGLGLATAYGIVKQSGGYISVTSEPGQGTTFSIYLPRTEDVVETLQPWHDEPALTAREGGTILLVEDADPLREVTREFLEEAGYEVLEANSADVALQAIEKHKAPISLMITDVVMPRMNGHTLAQRLKSLRPETKVLYVSGYTDEAVFRQGVRPSAANFLHKPYTKEGLIGKLRQVLDLAASSQNL